MKIIPAILPKSFGELEKKLEQIKGLARVVQIDICDGVFVPNKTWPYNQVKSQKLKGESQENSGSSLEYDESFKTILSEEEGMPYWDEVDFELDLMIEVTEEKLADLMKIGPKRIIFHIESLKDPKTFFENLDQYIKDTVEIGIGINISTPVSVVADIKDQIKFVQCMGIEKIGFQGHPFDERVVDKIREIKNLYPDLLVSVDGAVSFDTAPQLVEAGADRLIVGSAIFESENIGETIKELKNL